MNNTNTQDENIFADGFSFGSWFTSQVLPWIAIVFLGGVGSIIYGYWSLSVQVSQLRGSKCCGAVQSNTETIKELRKAVSILVKLHTNEGKEHGQLDNILDGWTRIYRPPAFKALGMDRLKNNNSRKPAKRRRHGPFKATLFKKIAYRDDKKRKKRQY